MLTIIFFVALFVFLFIFWCMLKVSSKEDQEMSEIIKDSKE